MKFKCEPIKPTPVILKVNNIRTVQINPQDATATPNDVEEGKIFYGKEGREVGTYKKKILTRIVIEPTKEIQNILPESPYDGFNEVQIEKIPDEYIIPEGILKIEENGVKNVTNYSEVEVEVYDDLNSELTEQETLLNELETQVNKLPEKPYDMLQQILDVTHTFPEKLFGKGGGFYDEGRKLNEEEIFSICNKLDTSEVRVFDYGFWALPITKVPNINTSKARLMQNTLAQSKVTEFPYYWDFSNVENMSLFMNGSSIENLVIPENTLPVDVGLNSAFNGCSKLKTVDININNTISYSQLFRGCSALIEANLHNFKGGSELFNGCGELVNVYGTINLLGVTASYILNGCIKIQNITFKNIDKNLQIGNGTSYGTLLTDETIINTFKELWDNINNTLGGTRTLTLSTPSYARAEAIYVKLVEVTDEMRAEDEYIDNKKPCVVCESTDEGAMTLKEYGLGKNWNIAK